MGWERPSFEDIKMDAEIGSYQQDDFEPPFCDEAAPVVSIASDAAAPTATE